MYRAGSPFSGKFVLFKPVLFVQVWPVGIQDVGPGERLNASYGTLSKPSSSGPSASPPFASRSISRGVASRTVCSLEVGGWGPRLYDRC